MFDTLSPPTQAVFQQLLTTHRQGKLAQAYLLYGAEIALPKEALLGLASALISASPESETDEAITRKYVLNGLHPHCLYVEPEEMGKDIAAEQARQVNLFLQTTPALPCWRIVILQPADRLNTAASNILLKNMEELPEKTTIFLVTSSLYKIKKTVMSRTQKIFIPSPQASLQAYIDTQPWAQEVFRKVQDVLKGAPLPDSEQQKSCTVPEHFAYFPEIIKHGLYQQILQTLAVKTELGRKQLVALLATFERVTDFVARTQDRALSEAHVVLALWLLLSPSTTLP